MMIYKRRIQSSTELVAQRRLLSAHKRFICRRPAGKLASRIIDPLLGQPCPRPQALGANPVPFHLTSVVLHWLDGCLLFTLLRKVRFSIAVAAGTVLMWKALPINSEIVAWISARAYLLAAFFVLLSALLAHRFLEKKDTITFAGCVLSAVCALLCHEAGILALPLVVLIAYAMRQPGTRSALALYSATAACVLYFGIRHLIGTSDKYRQSAAVAPFGIFFFKYLSWLVLPVKISIERFIHTPPTSYPCRLLPRRLLRYLCRRGVDAPQMAHDCGCSRLDIYLPLALLRPGADLSRHGRTLFVFRIDGFSLPCGGPVLQHSTADSFAWPEHRCYLDTLGAARLNRRLIDWSDPMLLYQSSLKGSPHSSKLLYNVGALSEQRGDLAMSSVLTRMSSVCSRLSKNHRRPANIAELNDSKDVTEIYVKRCNRSDSRTVPTTMLPCRARRLATPRQRQASIARTHKKQPLRIGRVLFEQGNHWSNGHS